MSKEEPAWRAELMHRIADVIREWHPDQGPEDYAEKISALINSHILAAEQRGFQAGVNRTGDSVGKLREQLKTAEQRGREQVLRASVAEVCRMAAELDKP